jgi:hypothetical protein
MLTLQLWPAPRYVIADSASRNGAINGTAEQGSENIIILSFAGGPYEPYDSGDPDGPSIMSTVEQKTVITRV